MNVITPTKKVAILRRFVDFRDLKCQEPENVLSRDMSRAPIKPKKRQKYTYVEKKNEKNEAITYTVGWFMKKKKKKSRKNVYPSLQY